MKNLRSTFLLILIIIILILSSVLIASKIKGVDYFGQIKNSVLGGNLLSSTSSSVQPLVIIQKTTNISTLENKSSIILKSNKKINIVNNSRVKLFLSQEISNSDPYYWYVAEITNIGIGDNNVSFNVADSDGNNKQIIVVINRADYSLPLGVDTITDWPNSSYTANGDNFKSLVNKGFKLSSDYMPTDLIDIHADLLLYTNASTPFLIRRESGSYLKIMASALHSQTNKNLVIDSAFRSYNEQLRTYSYWVGQDGQTQADKESARPGFSEHQLGSAVDFVDQETGLVLTNNLDNSVVGKWLQSNAYKYGFIQSYPIGKESITGYEHESWHYRYIGVNNATSVHDSGLTLIEWLSKNQ